VKPPQQRRGAPSQGFAAARVGRRVWHHPAAGAYAYVLVLEHPAWARVEFILKKVDWKSSAQHYRTRIFQGVLMRCADSLKGKRFTLRFPVCPECGEELKLQGG
jgi:hypothetical protein